LKPKHYPKERENKKYMRNKKFLTFSYCGVSIFITSVDKNEKN
jgi:hypothetical protein